MMCMKLVLVYVIGAYQMSFPDALEMSRQGTAVFARNGICVQVAEVRKVRDRSAHLSTLQQRHERFQFWLRQRIAGRHPGKVIHFLLPPMIEPSGARYMAGAAFVCRPRDGYSWSTGQAFNDRGEPRLPGSLTAYVHELAHVAGASHDQSNCNVMHEAALSCNAPTNFNPPALIQMKRCLGMWRRL